MTTRSLCRFATAISTVGILAVLTTATTAHAQVRGGVGVRAGVSAQPDQFYFGGHFDSGPIVERLSFRPNVEVGVGDNVTTVTANLEFAYWLPLDLHAWKVYVGGGPALNLFRYDRTDGNSSTDTKPGFNIVGGLAHARGLFAEVKVGFIDSPQVKFGVGYTWK